MEAFKNTKEVKISSLGNLVRILSSLYLLPLNISKNGSKITFSLFSFKTFIFAIQISLPYTILFIMVYIKRDYYTEIVKAFFEIYSDIDIFAMGFILTANQISIPVILLTCLLSKTWAAVPELSMDKAIKLPGTLKTLSLIYIMMNLRKEKK